MLQQFAAWLNGTDLSLAFKTTSWLVPASQSLHILAVAVVLSAFVMLTLRAVGRGWTSVGISLVNARFLPWVWGALVMLLLTGVVQIITEPERSITNVFFQAKMLLVAVVVLALTLFQSSVRRDPARWDGQAVFSRPVRLFFGVLVIATLVIIFCGRWIAYSDATSF